MYTFRSKPTSCKPLEIGFEFYTAEKRSLRQLKAKNTRLPELGFRSIPFQSKYTIQLDYMQRPKESSIFHRLISRSA